MNRRYFLWILGGVTAFTGLQFFSAHNKLEYTASPDIEPLHLDDAEWKRRLPTGVYQVLRQGATETRFSSPLNNEWRKGTYHCRGCGLDLFDSSMKYNSKTGWPSFMDHIDGHLQTYIDLRSVPLQQGYRCARCGGHHGHLFRDGPLPTGERWCNNGIVLEFRPA